MKKRRADERLLEAMNLESIALSRALIMEGRAFAGERKLKSPGEMVGEKEILRVRGRRAQIEKGAGGFWP